MRQVDGRADNHLVVAAAEAADKRPVDLQLVDGQPPQVAERRVAGPEVVDGEPHAHVVQLGQRFQRTGRIGHDDVFGDFERERRRERTPRACSFSAIRSGRSGSCRLRDDTFTEIESGIDGSASGHSSSALSSTSGGQPMDEARLLRQLHEVRGEQPALLRMIPSNQRFDADDEAGPQLQNRLILEKELVMVDRRREVGGERHADGARMRSRSGA